MVVMVLRLVLAIEACGMKTLIVHQACGGRILCQEVAKEQGTCIASY